MGETESLIFLYADGEPNDSENLMGSKLDKDPSPHFFFMKIQPVVCPTSNPADIKPQPNKWS